MDKLVLLDRILGAIYGQALGDAFGLATEFMDIRTVHDTFGSDNLRMIPFPNTKVTRHSMRWAKGDWTDDTDQLILIMQSLLDCDMEVNAVDFATKLQQWMYKGFPQCGDFGGMGIGMTVYSVLTHPKFLSDPKGAAREIWDKHGQNLAANGAVMRTAVLGILNHDSLDKVIQNTAEICHVTHADPRCLASCVAITTLIALLLQGQDNVDQILQQSRTEALKVLNQDSQLIKSSWISEFDTYFNAPSIDSLNLEEEKAIGYTYKCFACGVYALRNLSDPNYNKDYKLLFNEIAFKGGDSDTNLAVAGAVAGAYLGFDKLDKEWIGTFPYKSFLDDVVIRFCTRLGFDENTVRNKLNF